MWAYIKDELLKRYDKHKWKDGYMNFVNFLLVKVQRLL